jgi:serine/threonine protein kinase
MLTIDLPLSDSEPPPLPPPPATPPALPRAAVDPTGGAAPRPAGRAVGVPTPRDLASPIRSRRKRPTTLAPGMRIGAWRIDRELGRGGMATVYAVVHTRFGKRAALKLAHRSILGPQFTPETFLREARIANLINHAGVAEVFATGSYDGRPYLAMERLAGQSLGTRLDEGALPRDQAIDILIELCGVLEAAHAAGVIHRDLKLDNVFLLDGTGCEARRTKLLDWGMARIIGEEDPLRGLVAGTLTYVAPEQLRGEAVTPAADVYALGVLGYLLLLGRAPFMSRGDLELMHKHLHETPPRPRTLWAEIPLELDTTLVAMLAKQPEQRPALGDVVRVLRGARERTRPRRRRWLEPSPIPPLDPTGGIAPRPAGRAAGVPTPRDSLSLIDVIGRPARILLATRRRRIASAAVGIGLTLASLFSLLNA